MTTKKVYDDYREVKQIADEIGIKKTIHFLLDNIRKHKSTLSSKDVIKIYDYDYLKILDSHKTAKIINGFDIHIYSQFFFDYLNNIQDKKEMKILDFGCGTGKLCFALSSIGYRVHGIDYSEAAIDYANAKKKELTLKDNPLFECLDYFTLNQKYDFILFGDVVEHISIVELGDIFKKTKSLLTENGKILINTPNGRVDIYGNNFFWTLLSKVYHFISDIKNKKQASEFDLKHAFYTQSHINVMYPNQLKRVLEKSGFKRIKFHFLQDRNIPLSSFLSCFGISTDMSLIAENE